MKLKGIISIPGKPGLFKVLSQTKGGVIIESVVDNRRTMASLSSSMNSLDDISMYTHTEEVPLREIMRRIAEKLDDGPALDTKTADDKELADLFAQIVPDYDRDRVYPSHLRKLFGWYNTLQAASLVSKEVEEEQTGETDAKATKAENPPLEKRILQDKNKDKSKAKNAKTAAPKSTPKNPRKV